MSATEIVAFVSGWQHVLAFTAAPDDGTPEIAWGDTFFYYSPDGKMPEATQPFATIVTKNYPGDESSQLDREGAYRVNIHPSKRSFAAFAQTKAEAQAEADAQAQAKTEATAEAGADVTAAVDRIFTHPVYGSLGWLAVINPGEHTLATTRELLREAYELDRTRYERREAARHP